MWAELRCNYMCTIITSEKEKSWGDKLAWRELVSGWLRSDLAVESWIPNFVNLSPKMSVKMSVQSVPCCALFRLDDDHLILRPTLSSPTEDTHGGSIVKTEAECHRMTSRLVGPRNPTVYKEHLVLVSFI